MQIRFTRIEKRICYEEHEDPAYQGGIEVPTTKENFELSIEPLED